MTTTAVLFPGQGSQRPGMGAAFHEAWPATQAALSALDDGADLDLPGLCFEAEARSLRATEHAQPAVYAVGAATWAGLVEEFDPDPAAVAGHSLGHWTALAAAGGVDRAHGCSLVARRGREMAAAREEGPGRMVAVMLAEPATVADVCDGAGGASVAAFNAPRQTVVSGSETAVDAVELALDARADAVRFRDLDVAAAFHSPVMAGAADAFSTVVGGARLREADRPVVSDVTATAYSDPAVARRDLRAQLTAPVHWVGVLETLDDRGVERFVEMPPAGTLTELVEQTLPGAETIALESPADAAAAFG